MNQFLAAVQETESSGIDMSVVWYALSAIGLWKMFEKAGEPGWTGLIPFYRDYKLCEKVMNDPWYWVREFIAVVPLIGWIAAMYFKYQIGIATAKAYGKPESWAWGYLFAGPIFYAITGFDASSYYGPYGMGDHRSGDARQAKTVDFDVVKNEPDEPHVRQQPYTAPQPEDAPVKPAADKIKEAVTKESEVEFDFNQDVNE